MLSAQNVPPLINVGSGVDLTVLEIANRVAEVVGYRGTIEFDRRKPDGTPRKVLDISRLSTLGWQPNVSLRQGLLLTYRDFYSRACENSGELVPH